MIKLDIHKNFGAFKLDMSLETDSKRIGILGASGCGKSMTLKSIAGIFTPDEGLIKIDDRILFDSSSKINLKPQERNIGYMFQNYALFPNMTVRENIAAGIKGDKEKIKEKVDIMIEKFRLRGLGERFPAKLSGGQQQRVALARIIASEPDAILLDEPFSALDVYLKEKLQRELFDMLKDYEGLVIMVSHNRDEIFTFADSVLVMGDGCDLVFDSKDAVFKEPRRVRAAQLTGCKNISKAEIIDGNKVYLSDWDVALELEKDVPKNTTHIGIRAHDFIPVWGEKAKNAAKITEYSSVQYPFELHYYIEAGESKINWFIQRELTEKIKNEGMPDYLVFPENSLLFLEE